MHSTASLVHLQGNQFDVSVLCQPDLSISSVIPGCPDRKIDILCLSSPQGYELDKRHEKSLYQIQGYPEGLQDRRYGAPKRYI